MYYYMWYNFSQLDLSKVAPIIIILFLAILIIAVIYIIILGDEEDK